MCFIDVYEMAEARENRNKKQKEIIQKNHLPLISFTLNIPGPRKSSPLFSKIHNEGIALIKESFSDSLVVSMTRELKTGTESFFSINLPVNTIKNKTVYIEENHALGRIFDMDVLDSNGLSLSRRSLNIKPRKCLICHKEAALCSRSRTHSVEDLLNMIESISRML